MTQPLCKCMICGKICTAKEALKHEHNLWEIICPTLKGEKCFITLV
uniref:Uncharacterized protein n=2 Tax=viral metagenome TaxID=1070528 RepID=A0A6M3Y3X6_9ZZZZ